MPPIESKENNSKQEVVLTAYFSGTGHSIESSRCLAGFLYANNAQNARQIPVGFSGCGVTHGLKGTIFGTGLEEQARAVKKQVLELIKQGKRVKLNCYGHSRGAIAALMLAKMLGDFDEDILEVNLALMDAVPGNLLATQKLDIFGLTLANQAMDLSKCHNLKRVFSLYTNEPLSDLAVHAPLISKYPKKTQVLEDVIPGCHAGAQFQAVIGDRVIFDNEQSLFTFTRIRNFLKACGTVLESLNNYTYKTVKMRVSNSGAIAPRSDIFTNESLDSMYKNEQEQLKKSTRVSHSYRAAKIVTVPGKPYVNKHHLNVLAEAVNEPRGENDGQALDDHIFLDAMSNNFSLTIEPPHSPRVPRPRRSYETVEMSKLFNDFLTDLAVHMSVKSKSSLKGKIFSRFQSEAAACESFEDKQSLKKALRNVLALTLQRNRFSYSLFSTSASGSAAKELLRQEKYLPLAELIQGSANHSVRYRDLRMFVLGENNEAYFNAKNRERSYRILQDSSLLEDNLNTYRASLPLK